ncbi:hypothetical protein [Spongiactinospora sp. TRM90649]|uniref:hypothetical protein n=1 Tax=Spongiactinospora sp. TRM90649 TaxID=3031114 RepID=UPI0023F72945|nr:hypothetical protein [Spongiactinospora sp. TRM90649]MDF5759280.1 hypothetical protein [Spongiactinospora sp. TRM90649]
MRALYVRREISLEALAAELGVSRRILRRALSACAIPVRSSGTNTPEGRRSRVASNIAVAAARVETPDLFVWLAARRREGWSLAKIATALGRSVPWIRSRLADMERAAVPATANHTGGGA